MKNACLLLAILALGACAKADNEPGPGGVTMGEARALDDAAQMLDARRPPAELYAPARDAVAPAGQASGAAAPARH